MPACLLCCCLDCLRFERGPRKSDDFFRLKIDSAAVSIFVDILVELTNTDSQANPKNN